jgi:hypothetical protein
MPKYQFFKSARDPQLEVRYLSAQATDFLTQKEVLLAQGFEVVGDMIYARDEAEAIAHYNNGMSYAVAEYGKSNALIGLYYALAGLWDVAKKRFRRNEKQ